VHDVGTVDRQVFVAMEFIDGPTMSQWLEQEPRSWREIVHASVQAGRGLAAAHRADLVHRDFKPDNIMFGSDQRVRVLDFGLARPSHASDELSSSAASVRRNHPSSDLLASPMTKTGALLGTPAYMAPEQHAGTQADARSDQFGFCVALYQGLYGTLPFAGESLPVLQLQVLEGNVRDPPRRAMSLRTCGR
jgi:eukaryotic-like serine/threonine-protein kinase